MNTSLDLPFIRVLLADEDEDSHARIQHYLGAGAAQPFGIDWVASYEPALVAIARNVHDAYLIGARLGERTGLDLLREPALTAVDKPFIMLAGFDDPAADAAALQAGALDYLLKDELTPRLLSRSIRYAMDIKRAQSLLREHIQVLQATQAQIIQTEKLSALGTLVGGVAHELNNPLMGILNYVEYAQQRSTDPAIRQVLDKALNQVQRAKSIVQNMLTFIGAPEERLSAVSVQEAVERALQLLAADLRSRRIAVRVELPDSLPPVWAKLDGLQQVFMNLLANARDAVLGAADRTLVLIGYGRDRSVCVEVRDCGCGIPAHLQAKIFDPFFTTKPPGQGTGLGMTASRNIVLSFGGTLTLASQEGKGTTFTVTLKAAEPPAQGKITE